MNISVGKEMEIEIEIKFPCYWCRFYDKFNLKTITGMQSSDRHKVTRNQRLIIHLMLYSLDMSACIFVESFKFNTIFAI